jgi:hypothetical protein
VARLGEHAFDSPQAAGAFVALLSLTRDQPEAEHAFAGLEASAENTPETKSAMLRGTTPVCVSQKAQLANPDARVVFNVDSNAVLLSQFAIASQGIPTSDGALFLRMF